MSLGIKHIFFKISIYKQLLKMLAIHFVYK